jgi:putative Mn2+ efflux pump MntP
MPFTTLFILGLVIGSNNLAAALALGALGQSRQRRRVITVFGVFEFFIPLVGIWLGHKASVWIVDQAGWVGAILLGALGFWSVIAAIRHQPSDEQFAQRITTWRGLILLAVGLSSDNLIIGFSLGLRRTEPLVVASTIATFSMVFTWLGMKLGGSARRHWESRAELGAGLLLLGLAVASWVGWI